jgi:nucleotide-binding universal stress UspA family protein
MTEKVFVSYTHQDREVLHKVEKLLERHGIVKGGDVEIVDPVKELKVGDDIRRAIRDQIKSADIVVIVTSESKVESQWVNYEAGMADALGKPIVVVGRKGIGKSSLLANLADAKVIEIEDAS